MLVSVVSTLNAKALPATATRTLGTSDSNGEQLSHQLGLEWNMTITARFHPGTEWQVAQAVVQCHPHKSQC